MCSPQLSHSCKNSCSFAWDQPSDSEFSVIDTICRPLSTKRSRGSFDRSKHTNDAYASPILSSELSTVPQHRDHSSVSHTSDYSTGMSNRLPCEDSKSANDYDLLEWLEDCPSELFELYPSIDTLVTPEQRAGKFYQPTGIFQQSVNTDDHGNDDRMPPQDSMAQEVDLGSMTSTHSGCWMGALEATFEQENYAPSTSMMMDYDENNETFTKLSSIAVGGSARTPHVWTVADAEILRSHPTDPVGKVWNKQLFLFVEFYILLPYDCCIGSLCVTKVFQPSW